MVTAIEGVQSFGFKLLRFAIPAQQRQMVNYRGRQTKQMKDAAAMNRLLLSKKPRMPAVAVVQVFKIFIHL